MNTQSTGTVTLASAHHSAAPSIDPKFLSHPFDCRLAIESVRGALEFLDLKCLKKDEVRLAAGPAERGDQEILVCRSALPFTHIQVIAVENVKLSLQCARISCVKTQSACGIRAALARWDHPQSLLPA